MGKGAPPVDEPRKNPSAGTALISEKKTGMEISTKKVKEIDFILSECKLSQKNITCKLFAKSNVKDLTMKVYEKNNNYRTVLYDNEGYKYFSSKISVADDSADGWVQRRFIAGIPTSITLPFEGIKNKPANAALFEVECLMA